MCFAEDFSGRVYGLIFDRPSNRRFTSYVTRPSQGRLITLMGRPYVWRLTLSFGPPVRGAVGAKIKKNQKMVFLKLSFLIRVLIKMAGEREREQRKEPLPEFQKKKRAEKRKIELVILYDLNSKGF